MRFIHIADMHFDTPFSFLGEKENLGDIRRLEQRQVFNKIVEYIKKEKISYFFISGDLYDHKYVKKTTIEYINNLFKTIPETKIFISPGNHDPFLKNSYYNNFEWNKNIYIFNSEIKCYEFEDADIYGFGFDNFYCNNFNVENIKIKNKNKINILIIHGDIDASKNADNLYNPISKNEIQKAGFDYVAMGHIHKRQVINENIVYPGSTVSLGFDEQGEHGLFDVSLSKDNLEINFVKLDERIFEEKSIDITEINTQEELIEFINNIYIEENVMIKLILIGTRNFEIEENKILKLISNKNILKIKNKTKLNYNLEEISKQNNLKGIFINEMLGLLNDDEYDKEIIEKAIEIGLNNM
ncbi:MAG: exonuclease SbcCD subunit D [Clostridia bacterium]